MNNTEDLGDLKELLRHMRVPEECLEKFTGQTLKESHDTRMNQLGQMVRSGAKVESLAPAPGYAKECRAA